MWNKSVRWTGNSDPQSEKERARQYQWTTGSRKLYSHTWEDIHCRRKHDNETIVEEIWIPELAKQLYLDAKDTSVFDSNTGCKRVAKTL